MKQSFGICLLLVCLGCNTNGIDKGDAVTHRITGQHGTVWRINEDLYEVITEGNEVESWADVAVIKEVEETPSIQ